MVVPVDALIHPTVGQRALWLPPYTPPGTPIDMAMLTIGYRNRQQVDHHRPDLWGNYAIARE
jgi:hypothetical protein